MSYKDLAVFSIYKYSYQLNDSVKILKSVGFLNSDIKVLIPKERKVIDIEQLQKTMILTFTKIGSIFCGILFLIFGLIMISGLFDLNYFSGNIFLNNSISLLVLLIFGILFGAASGALIGIGTPQSSLMRLKNYIDAGGILLSVRVSNFEKELMAKKSVESSGAYEINLLSEEETWNSIKNKGALDNS